MSERKQDSWIITSEETIRSKVSFDRPLTAKQAMKAYQKGDVEDVLDQDFTSIDAVVDAEPWGDAEE